MKRSLGLLIVAPVMLIASACAAQTPPPTATAAPKAAPPTSAPTTAPAAKPAAEKPAASPVAEKPVAKPVAEKPAGSPVAEKPAASPVAAKPGTPPVVSPVLNATGAFNAADTLVLYGDLALFAGRENPENCILKNRYKRGEGVGFRMTAIEPASGKFAETAEIVVKVPVGDKVETLPMRYRGTGESPRPGFWTAKWVVPDDAPLGVIRYTVEAKDRDGRTGVWAAYNIEGSMLTIVP